MPNLSALRKRERGGRLIQAAVIGAGQRGSVLADQMARLAGLPLVAVCDVLVDRAAAAADVALDDPLTIVRLRRRRDALAGGAAAAS